MPMTVEMVRVWNARALADRSGGVGKFADRIDRGSAQVSHIIGKSPVKTIERRLARHIEEKCGVAEGWLDQVHVAEWLRINRPVWRELLKRDLLDAGISIDGGSGGDGDPAEMELLTLFRMLDPGGRDHLLGIARVLVGGVVE